MSRDPKAEPRFGDVFVWWNDRDQAVLYLTEDEETGWTGLNLEHMNLVSGYAPMDEGWEFVETITAHAAITADFGKYSRAIRAAARVIAEGGS